MSDKQLSREEAVRAAWHKGYLRYKLDTNQRKVYQQFNAISGSFYFNKPRRIGGSYFNCVMACEVAQKIAGAQVKYAAPTAKAVRKIIGPNMRKILADCPKDLMPKWSSLDSEYRFPNGSVIAVAGCDNKNYENLRGTESHLNIVDEVGFIADLEYIVNDVLMPMTQDTDGKTLLTGTPPTSLDHEAVRLFEEHQAVGAAYSCTIYDNPRLQGEKMNRFLAKLARSRSIDELVKSNMFRREYLAQFIPDLAKVVIPEWTDRKEELVHEMDVPEFYDAYVGLDVGVRDGHAAIFGHWDFVKAVFCVRDELYLKNANTRELAEALQAKETELWGDAKPYKRVADNNLLLVMDLYDAHQLDFEPTAKDNKELQINNVRRMISDGQLIVDPRCKNLIHQLYTTTWNANYSSYERTAAGHGDLVDALIYAIRNLDRNRNPFPRTGPILSWEGHRVARPTRVKSQNTNVVLQMFGRKTR